MKKRSLSILATLTAVAVLLVATLPTVVAASKIFDIRQDISMSFPNVLGICGDNSGEVQLDGWVRHTRWDDGHSVFKNSFQITVVDGSDVLIGEGHAGLLAVRFDFNADIRANQLSRMIHCSDHTVDTLHMGFTTDAKGVVHFHPSAA